MIWLRLKVGGQRITVHVVRPKHPKLEGAYGIYFPDSGTIYLSSALEEGQREDTLLHELDHVVNEVSGVNHVLECACLPGRLTETEEKIVRCRTPIWHRVLKDLGFRFPRGLYQ